MRMRFRFGAWCLMCFVSVCSVLVGQTPDSSARFPVYSKNKYGFIDGKGQVVIQPRFDRVMKFREGLAAVLDSDWNYIDESGKVVIAVRSRAVRSFSEGLAAVMLGGSYGYIDKKGNVVIPAQFEAAFDFSEGLARVKQNGKWAFIDKRGRTVFVAPFDYADDFRDGYALVAKRFVDKPNNGFAAGELKVSYIGKSGKLASIGWYNAASRFSEKLAVVSKDANIIAGFARDELIMDNFDISDPADAFAKPVSYSFINSNGQTVFEGTYEQVQTFAGGRAAVRIKSKWGYVNEAGELIIPAQFDAAEAFSEGLAFVKLNDEGYFIDTSGRIVFRTGASLIASFTNGLAQLLTCNVSPCQSVYVDKRGTIVWQGAWQRELE